ncbi:6-phosphogluconate dehydrogenase [Fervidobacterium changbaicum]|uniref:6-phosphogluconate dehydrogenase, decarboxylating n=2 Tax=Fervidobacterium TaxID=2422 RepID=A0AAI8CLK6_FERIS|nr:MULTISPECIES: NADP-dependent phosphogluconate dehydrogenase [Fervidobacterium]AMW33622.2 NADP-dependent phosphogluconate dehydrogenase [Fervidobacterium islandicum]SDH86742.1 6-phosphogluconate dehydrogenase [Fervidobacterium changbaicum]
MDGKSDVGIIGLGTMGKNLSLNFAQKGLRVSVYDKEYGVTKQFLSSIPFSYSIRGFQGIDALVESLSRPRVIILLITAGNPVDEVINSLLPFLEVGDIVIDSGNSHFKDTERRYRFLTEKGFRFLGMGLSGGSEGALKGPSLMPGGDYQAYKQVEEMLKKIAAKSRYGECVNYMGERSAGHFVKMVHNGIEYGIIAGISEVYQVMREVLLLRTDEIATIFEEWNELLFDSFLLRVASIVLRQVDELTGAPYIDVILDVAEQKGTGLWFTQTALELGIPAITIAASVNSRMISVFKELRMRISKNSQIKRRSLEQESLGLDLISLLKDALMFVNYIAFSEGLWLLTRASNEFGYNVQLDNVLKVWRKGSILESNFIDYLLLEDLGGLGCLIEKENIIKNLNLLYENVIQVSSIAKRYNIPIPVIDSAINFYLSIVSEKLPANLVQAIRDWFGYHGFYKVDKPNQVFHFEKGEADS